jgi:hypothetical protein
MRLLQGHQLMLTHWFVADAPNRFKPLTENLAVGVVELTAEAAAF